jgi:hypothetical protein
VIMATSGEHIVTRDPHFATDDLFLHHFA